MHSNFEMAKGLFRQGLEYLHLKQYKLAREKFESSLELLPERPSTLSNLAVAMIMLDELDGAQKIFDRLLELDAHDSQVWLNYGLLERKKNNFNRAIECLNRAVELNPRYDEAFNNKGLIYDELNQNLQALSCFDCALAINPENADAHWNRAVMLLKAGNFEAGWPESEWRWQRKEARRTRRDFAQPQWTGLQPLNGKTILLHVEQGLGDSIQFCRYASLVKAKGARVMLEVPKPLIELLRTLEGVDTLLELGQQLPPFDYHCPLLSLPVAFRSDFNSIPQKIPYLQSLESKRLFWSQRLGAKTKPRVGIVWSGNPTFSNDSNRSLTFAQIAKYLPDGIEFICLQKEVRDTDRDALQKSRVRWFGDEIRDFTDTAAICDQMDLVISTCTSVAHLAGALGRPLWIMLAFCADWRWMLERTDSPWYPTAKLYRQPQVGDWPAVLEQVRADLVQHSRLNLASS